MIVRIRFGRGRLVTTRKGKNSGAARFLASMLNLVSISFATLAIWRVGQDLGFLKDFVFSSGLLSHWQVWVAATAATQYACWRLTRYSRISRPETTDLEEEDQPIDKATARV
jgi:hypothetical protein